MKKFYLLPIISILFISAAIAQNVGIGTANPQEKLHIDGFLRGNQNGAVRVSTGNGYIDIGPKNSSWSHFETDRARFFFNQGITVDGGLIGSHSGDDLRLQTDGNNRLSILNSNGNVGIGTTSPSSKFEVEGGSATISSIKTDGYAEDVSGIIQGNYVPSHSWDLGTGSVGIFSQNGSTSENARVWYEGPHGNRVIAWRGNGAGGDADGGWNSSTFSIDHTKTYRVSIWIKKIGNSDGSTYLGCLGSEITTLGGTANTNPYFFSGDLPQVDKWYLIVGYIHGSGDASTTNYGGIYDSETGEKVTGITDFKFTTSATTQRHRTYLYYNSTGSNEQYFWDPRFEEVNGKEPSISALVGVSTKGGENYIKNQFASDQTADFRISGDGRVGGTFELGSGTSVNEFSTDGSLGGNSNNAIPTENAVKTYVDNQIGGTDDWDKTGNDIYNNNTGNVGIGVAPSSFKLDVNGYVRARDRMYVGTGGGYFYNDASSRVRIDQDFYTNNSNTYLYGNNTYLGDGSGDLIHLRGNQLDWNTGVLNTSGNLGLGTTGPSERLDVDGQIRIRGGSPEAGKVLMSDANGTATWEKEGKGEFNSGSVAAGNWYRIASNPGNRANAEFTLRDNISGGGHSTLKFQAGISYGDAGKMSFTMTSHSIYGTPTFSQVRILESGTYDDMYLEVYCARTGSVDYSIVDNLQGSGWAAVDWTAGSVPSGYTVRSYTVDNLFVIGDYQNRFTVSRGGNATLEGRFRSNGINETSDERFKKDITPLESSLENVLQMRGVNYYWKKNDFPTKGFTDGKEIGVIAQEIEKIYPELVVTDKDGYKSVQYSHLVPVLIEAIKEQQAIIESQKSQVDVLSSELSNQAEISKDQEARLKYLEEALLQQSKK